jgi:hypothetical protein
MPFLIEDILDRQHQRDSEWEELVDELNGDPELWEVLVDDDQWAPMTNEFKEPTKAIGQVD